MKKILLPIIGVLSLGLSAQTQTITLSDVQMQNARATGYAIIASKNPGINFSVKVIPWDGINTLEYNANNQLNGSWHPQAAIKGNYFNQAFDGTDFTGYSSVVTSQESFDQHKSTGTQWWIICSTIPTFSSAYEITSTGLKVDGIGKFHSNESGKSNIRFTINTNDAENTYLYNYHNEDKTYHSLTIGGKHSASTGMTVSGTNGYVGFGDATPVSKIDLGSNYSDPSLYPNKITLWSGGANNYFGFGISNADLDYFSQYNHRFHTGYNGSAGSEKMVLTSAGRLGVGTSSPEHMLHVANKSGDAFLIADASVNSGIRFINGVNTFIEKRSGSGSLVVKNQVIGGGLSFGTENITRMHIISNGNIGIGTTSPDEKLAVNGKIHTKEVKVDLSGWSDFVFYENYYLPTLKEVEDHIKENGHLKDIPSAKEVEEKGILLGEMNAKLLQKIEELTLYTIDQEKKIETQEAKVNLLEEENKMLTELTKQLSLINERLLKLEEKNR